MKVWIALFAIAASQLEAANLIVNPRLIPLTEKEARLDCPHPKSTVQFTPEVFSDRLVYWNDDDAGQFVATFFFCDVSPPGAKINLALANASTTLASAEIAVVETNRPPKAAFLLNTDALKPGDYVMRATLVAGDGKEIAAAKPCEFKRVNKSHPKVPIPKDGIPLHVHAQSEVSNVTWPITTGVPMPFGTLTDASALTLLEDGKPVPAQWSARATWTPGERTSIQWLGLDFLARYENGKPKEYRIVSSKSSPAQPPTITAKETEDEITVDTGVIRFQVNRKRFNGIEAAWLGEEKVIDAPQPPSKDDKNALTPPPFGPYLRDGREILYQAANDDMAEVRIEESGPVRVTIVARGWYTNKQVSEQAGQRLCQFVTRLTACAGQPFIDVNHRTVIAFDTRLNKLRNVSFAVPVVGATNWAASIDGKTAEGTLPEPGKSVWLHQERADRLRLTGEEKGRRADGWLSVSSPKTTVTGFLRDIWQRFPKELEGDRDGLIFHFWPQHGRRVFTEAEEFDKRNIYKAWFAHQGRMLDLQMPATYYDRLQEWKDQDGWDPERTSDIGYMTSGEGVAIGNEFRILLQPGPAKADELMKHARLFQQDAYASAAPSWNAATLAMGHLAARDDKRWPEVERLINDLYPTGMFNIAAYLGDYGMWIYGNTHNPWDGTQPRLHRIWQNSHYQHVGGTWLLYFRSGAPELLRWARANSDEYMDVGTVNYHNPDRPLKGRTTGAMCHAKGFVPWGTRHYGMFQFDADVGVSGHWVDPDAFLFRYYLEGNPRALDLYKAWSAAVFTDSLPFGAGRELSNTIGMMLSYYTATWDPNAIPYLRYMANGMLEVPFEKFPHAPSFPMWHKQWMDRYYDLTRDERVVAAIQSYIAAGFDHSSPNAFAYRTTGNKKYLERVLPGAYDTARLVYENPDDPLHGFAPYAMATGVISVRELPYVLGAMQMAGIDSLTTSPEDKSYYPVGASHLYSQTGRKEISLTILALDPDDREFKVTVGPLEPGMHPADFIVVSPSGKIMHVGEKLRELGKPFEVVTIPKDGEKGVYTIELFGHLPMFHAPLTDLPSEIARIPKDGEIRAPNRQMGYLILPPNTSATLKFNAWSYGQIPCPNYARVADATGKTLLETSLLAIGQRKEASIELKSGPKPATYPYYAVSWIGPGLSWTGDAEALYLARRANDIEPILKALPSTPPPATP